MSQCVDEAGQDHIQALIEAFRRLHEEKAAAYHEQSRLAQARSALLEEQNRRYEEIDKQFNADVAACQGASDPAACERAADATRDERRKEVRDWADLQFGPLNAQYDAASRRYWEEAPQEYALAAHDAGLRFAGAVDGCVAGSTTWRGRTGGAPSELLPDETYVAPGADGFIRQVTSFDKIWDLNPVVVEHAYDLLKRIGEGTSTRRRIRIVTHANPDVLFIPVFGARGGSKLNDTWLSVLSGGAVAVYQQFLGVRLDGPGWQDLIRDVLAQLDPNAPFYAELTLNNPSQQVRTLLAAEVMAGAREDRRIRFPNGTTGTAPSRFRECVVAWQEACRRALEGVVQEATLEAFARAVKAESRNVRPYAPSADSLWLADAKGALALGERLDSDLKAGRDACDTDTAVDIRGCTLGADTLALFAELIDIPAENVSGSRWFTSYPKFSLKATSWECRNSPQANRNLTRLASDSLTQIAVEELAALIRATDLAEVAGGDKVGPWANLPRRHKLIAMLEVWLFVAVSKSLARGTMGWVILDLGFDCGGMRRESLEVFLRSQWANATADRVGRVRDQWLASETGLIPVLIEGKVAGSQTAMAFQKLWSDQIITG